MVPSHVEFDLFQPSTVLLGWLSPPHTPTTPEHLGAPRQNYALPTFHAIAMSASDDVIVNLPPYM